jgi:glycosyltransferase involved in cell wall biosynthesis
MRILKVSEAYYPFLEKGGPPVKVRALAQGLAARGHSVTVLTADFGDAALERCEAGTKLAPSAYGRCFLEGQVEAVYLPSAVRFRSVAWHRRLRKFCRERLEGYDVAHIFGIYDLLGPAVARQCRALGLPYVVEPIGMFRPIVRSIRLKRMYHRLWGKALVRGAAALIATAEQELNELAEGGMPRAKIVLRRNGVERPEELPPRGAFWAKRRLPARAKHVLFLGRLVRKKSPELLLEAFVRMVKGNPALDAHLIFAGPDGGDGVLQELEQQVSRRGITERVSFVGALYGQEKWAAYRDADVFVLPSQNENFGNAVAEAVAAGTPVIVTETCGIAPLLAGRAGIVAGHEAGAIAQALAALLCDEKLQERLAAGCARVLPQLGWDEPVGRMEELYARLSAARTASKEPSGDGS